MRAQPCRGMACSYVGSRCPEMKWDALTHVPLQAPRSAQRRNAFGAPQYGARFQAPSCVSKFPRFRSGQQPKLRDYQLSNSVIRSSPFVGVGQGNAPCSLVPGASLPRAGILRNHVLMAGELKKSCSSVSASSASSAVDEFTIGLSFLSLWALCLRGERPALHRR